ncbi:MAG: hypothetical protein FJ280_27820 [Planctomycetes bacterium]|nr:hypothetical protein [Planctomycetota bacterium]
MERWDILPCGRLALFRRIGFVFHGHKDGAFTHNPFPQQQLSFIEVLRQLGLFGAKGTGWDGGTI